MSGRDPAGFVAGMRSGIFAVVLDPPSFEPSAAPEPLLRRRRRRWPTIDAGYLGANGPAFPPERAFGGARPDRPFVTSAREGREDEPTAGASLEASVDGPGLPTDTDAG